MRRILIAMMVLLLSATAAAAADNRCKVTDPTGTPLNVRDGPGGKIVGTLPNGTLVSIVTYGTDRNGKPWAYVKNYRTGKTIGWVFREFISCY